MSHLLKIPSILFWLICGSNYLFSFWFFLNYLFIGLLVVHFIEFFVFNKKIMNSTNNGFIGFINVMLFGILFINSLKDERT
jgi:hypothetical protein